MWRLKGCPKCGGDLFIDKDVENNWYAQCLQCSYHRELRDIREFEVARSTGEKKEPVSERSKMNS